MIDYAAIISVAFFGSFGHCIGMCGGFVVAYSSAKIKNKNVFAQFISHVSYIIGRISAYIILGFIFGYIGQKVVFSRVLNGYIFFIIGILMVLMGLSLMGKIKFLTYLESSILSLPKLKKAYSFLMKSPSKFSLYFLGFLNGLLPCGMVYFFLVSAVASGSALKGGLIMLIFGLCTVPAMLGFGQIIGIFNHLKYRALMLQIASVIVIIYGIYLSYLGFMATQT